MADLLDERHTPNMREQELYDYLYWDVLKGMTDLARRSIHYAILEGEIVPTKLAGKNYFSKQDGLDWLAAQRGKYKKGSKLAASTAGSVGPDGDCPRRD